MDEVYGRIGWMDDEAEGFSRAGLGNSRWQWRILNQADLADPQTLILHNPRQLRIAQSVPGYGGHGNCRFFLALGLALDPPPLDASPLAQGRCVDDSSREEGIRPGSGGVCARFAPA